MGDLMCSGEKAVETGSDYLVIASLRVCEFASLRVHFQGKSIF